MSRSPGTADGLPEQIARTTLRLVTEMGVDHVTTADVLTAMGTTRAVMDRYCPTEDDLWRTTAEFIERQMTASWDPILSSGQSSAERLRSLVAMQIGLIMNTPALREMLFSRRLHRGDTALRRGLCRLRGRFRALLCEILREGIQAGQFPSRLDPERTARRLTETLQGMVLSWSLDASGGDVIEEAWVRLDALVGTSRGRRAIAAPGAAARNHIQGA